VGIGHQDQRGGGSRAGYRGKKKKKGSFSALGAAFEKCRDWEIAKGQLSKNRGLGLGGWEGKKGKKRKGRVPRKKTEEEIDMDPDTGTWCGRVLIQPSSGEGKEGEAKGLEGG